MIRTDEHAVIIENKLYGAKDQPSQLNKYYDYVKDELKLEVDKIVYLSPNSSKKPEPQSIGSIPNSNELLKVIIGYDGESNDFYTQCIMKSIDELKQKEEKEEWVIFASHYLEILKETGVTKMTELYKDFYKHILENAGSYEKFKIIVDMMNNLQVPRYNYFKEELEKKLSDFKFFNEFSSGHGGQYGNYIRFSNNINKNKTLHISIFIYPNNVNLFLEFDTVLEDKMQELINKMQDEYFQGSEDKKRKISDENNYKYYFSEMAVFLLSPDESKITDTLNDVLNFAKKLDEYFKQNY